ncbi:hypothetical protein [Haloarcula sediminis]|uniref:hypothetical protein n=1 Tax=Haloarcula sediminis TaxID=3111777 RepID=UPI002D779504|nr:hypothetical protein [Haloarcula sp. CK38]
MLLPIRILRGVTSRVLSFRSASPATIALTAVAVVLSAVAGIGILAALSTETEVQASSAPLITAMLEWMTSGWGYVLAALVFGRGTVWGLRRARIKQAAKETGYSGRTIARMADEIRTTDGTTRAIIFGDDTREEARERILATFGGDDDRIYLEDAAAEESHGDAIEMPSDKTKPVFEAEESDSEPASWTERFKLWRMDLATALRTGELVWKFGVPALLVLMAELILVRFWVQWWLYPPLIAGALVAGIITYRADRWRRKRRLQSLRQERSGTTWEEIGVLVKTVEAEDATVHMGYLAGRRYASKDRQKLADALAVRALERSHGHHPSPAIEERYAWCLDRYVLNFDGWRENMEKPDIMDQLATEVLNSGEGILPKDLLAERVIEHDRRYIWQGLRFVGMGYDPDLVAECYDDLVPSTLVEHELSITSPDGEREVTAVRSRTETLPPSVADLRANFSDRFPVRQWDTRYDLPETEPEPEERGFQIPS